MNVLRENRITTTFGLSKTPTGNKFGQDVFGRLNNIQEVHF